MDIEFSFVFMFERFRHNHGLYFLTLTDNVDNIWILPLEVTDLWARSIILSYNQNEYIKQIIL